MQTPNFSWIAKKYDILATPDRGPFRLLMILQYGYVNTAVFQSIYTQ